MHDRPAPRTALWPLRLGAFGLLLVGLSTAPLSGQEIRQPANGNPRISTGPAVPEVRLAGTPMPAVFDALRELRPAADGEHALDPTLRYAREVYDYIQRDIQDYSCRLVKRERVDGRLGDYQYMDVKVRHKVAQQDEVVTPFSVYLRFLKPSILAGREVLFVDGQNGGNLIARRGGRRNPNMTLKMDPASPMAMDGNRYPITEIGVENLVRRMLEVLQQDRQYQECQVDIFRNAKLDGRSCTHVQVVHPTPRSHFRYHKATVFVDHELQLPVYFASYEWPTGDDDKPRLLEEYAYSDFKLNVGLTDDDFLPENPAYQFNLEELTSPPLK